MTRYLVERIGSNAYNQSYVHAAPVAIVDASSRAEAVNKTYQERKFTIYNNQFLRATPASRVSNARWEEAAELLAEEVGRE